MKYSPLETLEMQEIINKLYQNGYKDIVNCMLANEGRVYTKKGRLNKSSLCRELGWKSKRLEDILKEMRQLLSQDIGLTEEAQPSCK